MWSGSFFLKLLDESSSLECGRMTSAWAVSEPSMPRMCQCAPCLDRGMLPCRPAPPFCCQVRLSEIIDSSFLELRKLIFLAMQNCCFPCDKLEMISQTYQWYYSTAWSTSETSLITTRTWLSCPLRCNPHEDCGNQLHNLIQNTSQHGQRNQ